MQSVTIRAINNDDFEVWLPLWKGYQQFYKVEMAEAVTRVTWERLLNPAEPVAAALAIHDGNVVGLVHWIYHRSTWTPGNYCYLQDLFVSVEARGAGAGRALIEHVYEQAAQHEASRVYWLTHESNRDAMHLYDQVADRSGFIQYRRLLP